MASQAVRGLDHFVSVRQKKVARGKSNELVGGGAALVDAPAEFELIADKSEVPNKVDESGDRIH